MLREGLESGMRSKDVLWTKVTSLFAVPGRDREVAKASVYNDLHAMLWKDITLYILNDDVKTKGDLFVQEKFVQCQLSS